MNQSELPMEYNVFMEKMKLSHPDFFIRIICEDGIFKIADQMINLNRIDVVIENGLVVEVISSDEYEYSPKIIDEIDIENYNCRFDTQS